MTTFTTQKLTNFTNHKRSLYKWVRACEFYQTFILCVSWIIFLKKQQIITLTRRNFFYDCILWMLSSLLYLSLVLIHRFYVEIGRQYLLFVFKIILAGIRVESPQRVVHTWFVFNDQYFLCECAENKSFCLNHHHCLLVLGRT